MLGEPAAMNRPDCACCCGDPAPLPDGPIAEFTEERASHTSLTALSPSSLRRYKVHKAKRVYYKEHLRALVVALATREAALGRSAARAALFFADCH